MTTKSEKNKVKLSSARRIFDILAEIWLMIWQLREHIIEKLAIA